MKKIIKYFKAEPRNIILILFTVLVVQASMLFPNAIPRLIKSIVDVFVSFLYYCFAMLGRGESPIPATVTQIDAWQIFPEVWEPVALFPHSLEEFFAFWGIYFKNVFSSDYFIAYLLSIYNVLDVVVRFLAYFSIPLFLIFKLQLDGIKNKKCDDDSKKSRQLIRFEKFYFNVVLKIVAWIKDFVSFCGENSKFVKLWIILACLYFNVFSILISFIAYYLYFVSGWNLLSIYGQILKLQSDLTPIIRFMPGIIWLCLAIVIYNAICRSKGFQRLYRAEECNRAFLRERGIVSVVFGAMGTGKTQLITSMARSAEVEMFDEAYKIMLDKDIMFPNFPWHKFRNELKKQIDKRKVYDLKSCERWVRGREQYFVYCYNKYSKEEFIEIQKRKKFSEPCFGYDYEHYSLTYNDELKITTIYDALVSYAQAYMIFTVKTTLLFSNYSIRVDSLLDELGTFPARNSDFFDREPKLIEAHQQHSHIIDYDMLRLGRKLEHSVKLNFGVFVITEIDKERKNSLDLKEYKIREDETNQKNDLFNACLKMCRHAAIADNKVFIRIICDLQRPEDWGAGGREVGEVIYIKEQGKLEPVLPFYSPYWLTQGIFEIIKNRYKKFKQVYESNRSDGTLTMYLFKNIVSKLDNYFVKQNGLFGKQTLKLEIQKGTLEGDIKKDKWRILTKKDRSNVYRTDCLNQVFENYEAKPMHIDDFVCYAGSLATQEELSMQKSYFQRDISKMKGIK